jgi:diaminohydroxyphosphoribosylaminopyrimidine deaminase / 5-amino-6-(5-phosphoribosylamino)uracil reductase
LQADQPRLDVRLPGLEGRSPARWVLTGGPAAAGWSALPSPEAVHQMADVQYLFVEGGAQTARAFLAAGLVDRLLIYRAPFAIGPGVPALPELAAGAIAAPWHLIDTRPLGSDALEVYEKR